MLIRRIRADESDAYRDVRLRALADAPRSFGTTHPDAASRSIEEWRVFPERGATSDGLALFVAEGFEYFSGLLMVVIEGDRATLNQISVDPSRRGTGLGRALLDAACAWAAERGARILNLWVTEGNVPAIALYEAYGFTFTDATRPHPSQPPLRELAMGRDVTSESSA